MGSLFFTLQFLCDSNHLKYKLAGKLNAMVLVGRVLAITKSRLKNHTISSTPPLLLKLMQESSDSRIKTILDSEAKNTNLDEDFITSLRCSSPHKAQLVLEWKLEKLVKNNERDESCYSDLIYLCGKVQNVQFALQIFTLMESHRVTPTTGIFNSLIHACLSSNNVITALSLFEIMQRSKDCKPNSATYKAFMSVYSKLGDITAMEVWYTSTKMAGFPPTVQTFEYLISGYIKAQNINTANKVYDEMVSLGITPSLSILENMLEGLCEEKNHSKIKEFVKFIMDGGWKINEKMAIKLVHVYSMAGMVSEMEELVVTIMRTNKDSVVLSKIHYGIIKMYALSDRLDDMEFAIGRMLRQGILFTYPDDIEKVICSYFRREAYERLDLFLERIRGSYKLNRATYDLLIAGYRRAGLSDKLELVIKEMNLAGL